MIFHATRKLADRLLDVSKEQLLEDSPLGSWHADRLTLDHRQCVLFCHDASRAVLFLAGLRKPEFENLGGEIFRSLFTDTLVSLGIGQSSVQRTLLATGPIRFDATTDRSVLSSMRVARQDLEAYLVTSFPNVLMIDGGSPH